MAEVQVPNTASGAVKANADKKTKIFGQHKKADTVVYRAIKENDVRMREDTPRFKPYQRFPNFDIIRWNYGTDADPDWSTRAIRWLPGEQSIFVDEQEKEGRKIPENILNNSNNRFEIINGEIRVPAHQKTKIMFLDYCNRNEDSPYSTGQVKHLFRRWSEEKKTQELSNKQQKQQEAIQKAFAATEEQIAFHADYLGISLIDMVSGATRGYDSVVADYRQVAVDDPVRFLKTFDDQDLKLKYQIKKAIEGGRISLSVIPGKIVVAETKEELMDAPEKTDAKQLTEMVFLFSQTAKGGSLLKKLAEWDSR